MVFLIITLSFPVYSKETPHCYTKKQQEEMDIALDEGIKALNTLNECRTWRDRYKIRAEALEENPLIQKELVLVDKKKFSKKTFAVTAIGSFILGIVIGKAL